MTQPFSLARVTVATPRRRIDVAIPESVPVAELLPHLLRHAGEGAADDGELTGGWTLRRAEGTELAPLRTLASQDVRDGETLHLVPRRLDWPELSYDDVVEVIAEGSRNMGRSWGAVATRRCALAVSSTVLLAGAVFAYIAGSSAGPAAVFALVLTVVGIVVSRTVRDPAAGALVAAAGLPYAFVAAVSARSPVGPTSSGRAILAGGITAGQLLAGSAVVAVLAAIGYLAVTGLGRLFVAGLTAGLLGVFGAVLRLWPLPVPGAVAVSLTVAIGLLPAYPLLAAWLGRLPVPTLPQRAGESDPPPAAPSRVFAAVTRSYELLTGFLLGACLVGGIGILLLLTDRQPASVALACTASAALLLRARLFPTARQRAPLIVAGVAGLAVVVGAAPLVVTGYPPLVVELGAVGLAAAAVLAGGLLYGRRRPSPYLGRLAEVADVLAIMALVPLTCVVAGLYAAIQSLFASM